MDETSPILDSTDGTTTGAKPKTVPLAALEAERRKRQDLAAQLAEIERKRQEREAAEAAERGEFERLYQSTSAELEAAKARTMELEQREQERIEAVKADNDQALAQLPEHLRALVPANLDPFQAQRQIAKLQALATDAERRPAGTRRPTGSKPGDIDPPPECIASAKHHGRDPKTWFPIWLKTSAGKRWKASQTSIPT